MAIKSVTADNVAEFAAARAQPPAPVAEKTPPETPEQASAQAAAAEVPGAKAEPKEAPKNSVQARIDELTREKKELDELAQTEYEARLQAQRRIAELEAQVKTVQPEPKAEPKPRPDRAKYDDPTKYENDLLEWNQEETLRKFRAEQEQAQREAAQREAARRLEEQKETARAKFADFDEVIAHADKTLAIPATLKPVLDGVAVEGEHGVEVLYHLAKHPDEAKRIFALKPVAAAMALGRIEEQYMAKAAAKAEAKPETTTQPPVSKAPPPLPSLSSGATGTVVTDLSQPLSYKDYKRVRMGEIKQRRAR